MKPVLFIVLLLFVAQTTFGQQFDKNKMFYAAKADKYRRLKSTGMLLTLLGTGLTIAGISKMSKASTTTTTYNGNSSYTSTNSDGETGALMFLGGTAGLGAGIPLWIVGSHAQHKYERKLEGLSVQLNMYQQNKGLTLRYRF